MEKKDEKIEFNAKVRFNKVPLILWWKRVEKDARIDDFENPARLITDNVDKSLKKVSRVQIFFVKYLPVFIFLYLFNNLNLNLISIEGLTLASIFYIIGHFVKKRTSLQTTILLFSVVPAVYMVWGVYDFKTVASLSVGMVLNFTVQYAVMFYVVYTLISNLIKEKWKYYSIDGFMFRYLILKKNSEDINSNNVERKLRIFNRMFFGILVLLGILGSIFTTVEILHKQLVDREVAKALLKKETTYTKSKLLKLDKEAKKINLDKKYYVHNKIYGVERYLNLTLTKDTKFVEFKILKNDKNKYIFKKVGKIQNYNSKDLRVKAFVYHFRSSYFWVFFKDSKIYLIVNRSAR